MSRFRTRGRWGLLTTVIAAAITASTVAALPAAATTPTWGPYPVSIGDITFGPDGALYGTDCWNARIYRIAGGTLSVIAGAGDGGFTNGYSGDRGPALAAHMGCPQGLAFDRSGNLYVADHLNDVVRRIDRAGIITTVVGTGPLEAYDPGPWIPGVGHAGDGGPATKAVLDQPWGITFDARGNLFIADRDHDAIRKVDTNGIITTVAGNGAGGFSGDGKPATASKLDRPLETVIGPSGDLLIADENNARIRSVGTTGLISTFAGTGRLGCGGDGGPATSAELQNPHNITLSPGGSLYISSGECHVIRRVMPDGTIVRVAGTGIEGCAGFDGARAATMQLTDPAGMRFDAHGDLYVADDACNIIFRIDTRGMTHLVVAE
jgi:hypothetical protein